MTTRRAGVVAEAQPRRNPNGQSVAAESTVPSGLNDESHVLLRTGWQIFFGYELLINSDHPSLTISTPLPDHTDPMAGRVLASGVGGYEPGKNSRLARGVGGRRRRGLPCGQSPQSRA